MADIVEENPGADFSNGTESAPKTAAVQHTTNSQLEKSAESILKPALVENTVEEGPAVRHVRR